MIRRVEVKNFKSLRDVAVDLEPFTVLVGANGSGKTALLEAIKRCAAATQKQVNAVFKGEELDWMHTRGGSDELVIQFTNERDGRCFYASRKQEKWHFTLRQPIGWKAEDTIDDIAQGVLFMRLDSRALARPSSIRQVPPPIEQDGAGLASVLAYMALNDPDRFAQVVDHARSLLPRLQRLRFDKVDQEGGRTSGGYDLVLFDFKGAIGLPAPVVSEGTLLVVGLLAVLLGPTRPRVLLLDDIDQGLHPLAQRDLIDVLDKIFEQFPDLQVIATSHSPYLLDRLSPDQVRIMALGDDGYSRCGRLTDHPSFEKWKDEMLPGELWSLFGERWLVEPEPSA